MWSLLVSSLMVCASAGAADLLKGLVQGVQQEAASISRPVVSTVVTGVSTQCSNVKKLIGVDYEQVEGRKEPDLNQLSLKYVTPKLNISFNINTVSDVLLHLGDQKLAIFVHGFTDDPSKESFRTISSAFLETGKYHVLALDGSSLIRWLYLRSTTYVRFMGEKLGTIIAGMVNAGYDPSNLHLVGHSLGAHISGFTGKQFTLLTGLKVARVTGLDPAGPCFSNVDPELRLKATDAEFVDVIHTRYERRVGAPPSPWTCVSAPPSSKPLGAPSRHVQPVESQVRCQPLTPFPPFGPPVPSLTRRNTAQALLHAGVFCEAVISLRSSRPIHAEDLDYKIFSF